MRLRLSQQIRRGRRKREAMSWPSVIEMAELQAALVAERKLTDQLAAAVEDAITFDWVDTDEGWQTAQDARAALAAWRAARSESEKP